MGINAREVVRVFACSTQLSYNLSKEKHTLIAEPFRKTALSVHREMDQIKETLRLEQFSYIIGLEGIWMS